MSSQNPDADQRVRAPIPNSPNNTDNSNVGSLPHQVMRSAAERIAPHTAISSTQAPAGDTENAIKTNTAFPAASLANPEASNAGARMAGQPEELQPSAPKKVEQKQAQGSTQPVTSPQGPYQQAQQKNGSADSSQVQNSSVPQSHSQAPPTQSNIAPVNEKVCIA